MEARLDRAVIPPGWIRNAKTYTLIMKNNILFVLHTGAASRLTSPNAKKYRIAADMWQIKYDEKIVKSEEDINLFGAESYASNNPKSFLIQKRDIQQVEITQAQADKRCFVLKLKTTKKKYLFECRKSTYEEVVAFAETLTK